MTQNPDFSTWVGEQLKTSGIHPSVVDSVLSSITKKEAPVPQALAVAKIFTDADGDSYAFIGSDSGQYVEMYYASPDTGEWESNEYLIPATFLTPDVRAGIGNNLPDIPEDEDEKEYSVSHKWNEEFYCANEEGVFVWLASTSSWVLAPPAYPNDHARIQLYRYCRNDRGTHGLPSDPYSRYENFYADDDDSDN